MDPGRHAAAVGATNALVLANFEALARSGAAARVRYPLVPGLNDGEADLAAAADFLAGLAGRHGAAWPVDVLPYHDSARGKYALWGLPYPLPDTPVPAAAEVERAIAFFRKRGLDAGREPRVVPED
jgi:pyruvate formate lyase activating enzyme